MKSSSILDPASLIPNRIKQLKLELLFISNAVQILLKNLIEPAEESLKAKRWLDNKPYINLMTDKEIQKFSEFAQKKRFLERMTMAPFRFPIPDKIKILSQNPEIMHQYPEKLTSKYAFIDLSKNLKDHSRLTVIRDSCGTLRLASCIEKLQMLDIFYPSEARAAAAPYIPQYITEPFLADYLAKYKDYEYVLDTAVVYFKPGDPRLYNIMCQVFSMINENNDFSKLEGTRHFGALVFFLINSKSSFKLTMSYCDPLKLGTYSKIIDLAKLHIIIESGEDIDESIQEKDILDRYLNYFQREEKIKLIKKIKAMPSFRLILKKMKL